MSRYYPKGTPKNSVRPIVPYTFVVLFAKRTFGGLPRTSALQTTAYVYLLRVNVWLLFSKGSRRD
jgi:hypothetical protein